MTPKAVLVTGGAQRLGKAMVMEMAAQGAAVAVHYSTSADAAECTVAEVIAQGGRAVALQADLLDEDQTNGLIGAASEALQMPLDVLVNNASIFEYDNVTTATRQSWDRHMGSNLRAPFILTQHFAAQAPDPIRDSAAEATAQACIINMIDQRVRKLTPEFMTYTLAKSALWTFTQTSAQALAPAIRVNGIGPGPTIQGHRQSKAHFEQQRKSTILERGADAGDIVAALRFILSAPSVTGQLICADGGQHLGWKTPDILGVE